MQNSMILFTFLVFEWKYPFRANLVQKIKIISSSWNLVPALIRTCRIQWWYSLFLFLIGNTLFRQIWSKKSKLSVEAEIWYLHSFEYAEFNCGVHFFCFWVEMLFLGKFGPKDEIVSSRWNSRFKLFQICRIQWWRSLFLFLSGNTLFGQIWSKKSKFLFQAEIWYPY